jgi:glycosyltransferase involved in cell wall biosynthesis
VGDARAIVGDAGAVVRPRDPVALASAIADGARLMPPEREARGSAARQRILDCYTIERAIAAYERIYAAA